MPTGPHELRVVVTVGDVEQAVRFYRDALGMDELASFTDDNGGRASLLRAGRATIEVGDDAHAEAIDALEVGRRVAGPVRIAFEVDDVPATTERLVAAGGRLVAGPVTTPWGSLNARLDGPDAIATLPGRVVEVFCRVDRAIAGRRYAERRRHPGHFDQERAPDELWNDEVAQPLAGGWPVLEQDTSSPVDLEALVQLIDHADAPRHDRG